MKRKPLTLANEFHFLFDSKKIEEIISFGFLFKIKAFLSKLYMLHEIIFFQKVYQENQAQ